MELTISEVDYAPGDLPVDRPGGQSRGSRQQERQLQRHPAQERQPTLGEGL
jgi:hypothetical protein